MMSSKELIGGGGGGATNNTSFKSLATDIANPVTHTARFF